MARLHQYFDFDENKAAKNLRNHRVSFDDAMRILSDPDGDRFHLEVEDDRKAYGEARLTTYAPDRADRAMLYLIV